MLIGKNSDVDHLLISISSLILPEFAARRDLPPEFHDWDQENQKRFDRSTLFYDMFRPWNCDDSIEVYAVGSPFRKYFRRFLKRYRFFVDGEREQYEEVSTSQRDRSSDFELRGGVQEYCVTSLKIFPFVL